MDSDDPAVIAVEVAYARPDTQFLKRLNVPAGSRLEDAVRRSGVLERFPEIELESGCVGIFGRRCALDQALADGDRVEIYRPLTADPKDARRARLAAKARRG